MPVYRAFHSTMQMLRFLRVVIDLSATDKTSPLGTELKGRTDFPRATRPCGPSLLLSDLMTAVRQEAPVHLALPGESNSCQKLEDAERVEAQGGMATFVATTIAGVPLGICCLCSRRAIVTTHQTMGLPSSLAPLNSKLHTCHPSSSISWTLLWNCPCPKCGLPRRCCTDPSALFGSASKLKKAVETLYDEDEIAGMMYSAT
jgi:hypothetical protein